MYLHTVFHRLATARVSTLAFFCPANKSLCHRKRKANNFKDIFFDAEIHFLPLKNNALLQAYLFVIITT